MNFKDLENGLRDAPETRETVDARLHGDIMRSVRLADAVQDVHNRSWTGPAIGSALAVMLLALLHFSQPVIETPEQSSLANQQDTGSGLFVLGEKLRMLSVKPPLTEAELEMELERLKSDLKRFDFRS